MANNISIDGKLLLGGAVAPFGITAATALPAATAQSAVASTTITSIGSTSLTAADLTRLNALIDRVEAIRVLQDAQRSAEITSGVMKGSI